MKLVSAKRNLSKQLIFIFSYQLLQGTSKQTSATRRVLGDSRQTNLDQRETLRFKKSVNIALQKRNLYPENWAWHHGNMYS